MDEKWEIFCFHLHEEDMHVPENGDPARWQDLTLPVADNWEPITVTYTGEAYMVWCKRRKIGGP